MTTKLHRAIIVISLFLGIVSCGSSNQEIKTSVNEGKSQQTIEIDFVSLHTFPFVVTDVIWSQDNQTILAHIVDGNTQYVYKWNTKKKNSEELINHQSEDPYGHLDAILSVLAINHFVYSTDQQAIGVNLYDRLIEVNAKSLTEKNSKNIDFCQTLTSDFKFCADVVSFYSEQGFRSLSGIESEEYNSIPEVIQEFFDAQNPGEWFDMQITISPDMSTIFAKGSSGDYGLWNFETLEQIYSSLGNCSPIRSVVGGLGNFSLNSQFVLLQDCTDFYVWSVSDGEFLDGFKAFPTYGGEIYELSPSGKYVVTATHVDRGVGDSGYGPIILIYNTFTKEYETLEYDLGSERQYHVTDIAFSLDERKLAVSYENGTVFIFSIK